MNHWIIKLRFLSPLRIGREEIDLEGLAEGLHSDTLFSALCHAWADLYGQEWLDHFLNNYQQKPAFLISSAFPFYQNQLFLPRPFLRHHQPDQHTNVADQQKEKGNQIQPPEETIAAKEWKKIAWLAPTSLRHWLAGQKVELEQILQENQLASQIGQVYTVPRVALDRFNAASNIYFCSQLAFNAEAGLYFILRVHDESYQPFLRAGLEYLGDCGLGSERNNGYGQFQPTWQQPPQPLTELLNQSGSHHYLLSLFNPTLPLPSFAGARYGLLERRGYFWSASTGAQYKRCSVWMVQEGSILPFTPIGRLVDVTPSICGSEHHRIYRCGIPLTIQFSEVNDENHF